MPAEYDIEAEEALEALDLEHSRGAVGMMREMANQSREVLVERVSRKGVMRGVCGSYGFDITFFGL